MWNSQNLRNYLKQRLCLAKKRRLFRSALRFEQLESRQMMAFTAFHNPLQPLNVSGDPGQIVSPLDVLLIVNELNTPVYGAPFTSKLPVYDKPPTSKLPYLDTSCDGFVTPLDALFIINALNSQVIPTPLKFESDAGDALTQIVSVDCRPGLSEGTAFLSSIKASFIVPQGARTLRLSISPVAFDKTSATAMRDAFEVALVDAHGNPLVHPIKTSRDAFFNSTEDQPIQVGVNAQHAGNILLDLEHIPSGTEATLVIRLINNDGDTQTYVEISRFEILSQSLGTPAGATLATTLSAALPPVIDFAAMEDVTPSLLPRYGQTSFKENDEVLFTELSLANVGSYEVNSPIVLVVDQLSDPEIRLRQPDGVTPDGKPYFVLDNASSDPVLRPGQTTKPRNVPFHNPTGKPFTYAFRALGTVNRSPVIVSQPGLEAIVGKEYQYSIVATDADADKLSYSVLAGPSGMQRSGDLRNTLTFRPSATDKGNHTIQIQVSDDRGGVAQQSFVLTVIDPPPNRPPIFTTSPIVDSEFGMPYVYEAKARDPDSDPLTFELLSGPPGMRVNRESGKVDWTATTDVFTWDADKDFSAARNPGGPWSYGWTESQGSPLHIYPRGYKNTGIDVWEDPAILSAGAPAIAHNGTDQAIAIGSFVLQPGQINFHPGNANQRSVARWTAPLDGDVTIEAAFANADPSLGATTDVHVLHNNRSIYDGVINGHGSKASLTPLTRHVAFGDTIDFIVGFGSNNNFGFDSTTLVAKIKSIKPPVWNAADGFSAATNPVGPWSYGWTASQGSAFNLYPRVFAESSIDIWDDASRFIEGAPSVAHNRSANTVLIENSQKKIQWAPGQLSFHPGTDGQRSVVRWTAPVSGDVRIDAEFGSLDLTKGATTDVHVLHNNVSIFDGIVTRDNKAQLNPARRHVSAGDTIDFIVGQGSEGWTYDTTSLNANIALEKVTAVPVTLAVFDDRGGITQQSFHINIQPPKENHSPIVVSTPPTNVVKTSPVSIQPGFSSHVLATLPQNSLISGLALSGDGKMYIGNITGPIYQRDMASGNTSVLKSSGLSSSGRMVVSSGGGFGSDLLHADWNVEATRDCCQGTVFRTNRQTGESSPLLVGAFGRDAGDPRGVAIGPGGAFDTDLFVMDFQGISTSPPLLQKLTPDKQVSTFAQGAPWTAESSPGHIVFSPGGGYGEFLYAADDVSKKIWRISPTGQISEFSTSETLAPVSLQFAPGGAFGNFLYALEASGRIVRIEPDGKVLPFAAAVADIDPSSTVLPDMIFDATGEHLYLGIKDRIFEISATSIPSFTYEIQAVDADNDKLSYTLTKGPAGIQFDAASRKLNWTPKPTDAGSHTVAVQVEDGRGGSAVHEFNIVVAVESPGSISGTVYDDRDGSGNRNSFPLAPITVIVPGFANPYLAGMPDGSTDFGSDIVPAQSPILVPGFSQHTVLSVTVSAQGGVNYHSGPPTHGPDGDFGYFVSHIASNGISTVVAPANALLGVFLGPDQPNLSAAPSALLFEVNYQAIAPELKQLFFIGDGKTDSGMTQTITVPNGATRLFLGTMDGFGWFNNSGSITAQVSATVLLEPGVSGRTLYLDQNNNAQRDLGELFTHTDANGHYAFSGLAAGSYVVRNQGVPGFKHTSATSSPIQLAAGQHIDRIDFGTAATEEFLPNANPIITSPPPANVFVAGATNIHRAAARDPDSDELVFDLPVAPAGMTIEPALGALAWTPTLKDVGDHDVILRVRDRRDGVGLQSFRITVRPPNTIPQISSTPPGPATAGLPYQYIVRAQDADGDNLTYAIQGAINGMTITPDTGVLNWSPTATDVGSHTFTITATDPLGARASQIVNLNVVATSVNRDPVIIVGGGRKIARLGDPYTYFFSATDPDGDPVTYSLPVAPAGMAIDSSGVVTWTPTGTQFGANPVQFKASDGRGGQAIEAFTILVRSEGNNLAPTILSKPVTAATMDTTYQYDVEAIDADGDTIAFGLLKAPVGMSIDPLSGQIRWTPTASALGKSDVAVQVADSLGKATVQEFSITVRGENLPPLITSAARTSSSVGRNYIYTLEAQDPEGGPLAYSLSKSSGNMAIDSAGVLRWTPTAGELGPRDVIITVTDNRGAKAEQAFTVAVAAAEPNKPPIITSQPKLQAILNQPYSYQVTANDPDGTELQYAFLEFPNGMTIDRQSGLVQWTPNQTGIGRVTLYAIDPDNGDAEQSFEVVVTDTNRGPTITSRPASNVASGATFRYDLHANDPDGDRLFYELSSGPSGMTIDSLGRVAWTPSAAQTGLHKVKLTVSDGRGASVSQEFDLTVTVDTTAPLVYLSLASPIKRGEELVIVARATDNVAVERLELTVDGLAVPLDSKGRAAVVMNRVGNVEIMARAVDLAGNVGRQSATVLVIDSSVTNSPEVDLTSPSDNITVTAPTDVIGTVKDSNLASWRLEVAPFDSGNFTQIASGTTQITNAKLGVFDPTLLQNDSYILRLTAINTGGLSSSIEQIINVTGNLKLGNFTLSFTDLSIPVAGIPITVARTYDTLQANQDGELGFGWKLAFRDVDLRTSLPKTGDEAGGLYTPFRDGTRVYITLPGGQRQGFTFRPKAVGLFDPHQRERDVGPETQSGNGLRQLYFVPSFVPDKGVTSKLTVPRFKLFKQGHEYSQFGGGLPYNPADPSFGGRYLLTTKEGLTHRIDADTGKLVNVTDRNGNVLEFASDGVSSTTGVKVRFERDSNGRIVKIVDPMGKAIEYHYDASGDLGFVVDRSGNKSVLVYSSTHRHYLEKIIDPLGNSGIRTEYDEKGRIKGVRDAGGNLARLTLDPALLTEKSTDPLGNVITRQFDERGNPITIIDALGNVTKQTFDEDNNLLSVTNALGKSSFFTYDANGNTLTETDTMGNTTRYTYNALGQRLTTAGPSGVTSTTTYDERGNPTVTVDGLGNTTRVQYDAKGRVLSVMNPKGASKSFAYDSQGRTISVMDALGNVHNFTYDANGNRLTESSMVTTPSGKMEARVERTFDSAGRVLREKNAEGHVKQFEYDANGRLVAEVDGSGMRTTRAYDQRGQVVAISFPGGGTAETKYDALGRIQSSSDLQGQGSAYIYDALGRIAETISLDTTPNDPNDNPRLRTEYDANGQVIAEIDEFENRTEFSYDAAGRLTRTRDPLGGVTTYTYDADGHRTSETDALGRTTRFVHDELGREVQTIFADGSFTRTIYNDGRGQHQVQAGDVAETVDEDGNITKYLHDLAGRLAKVTDAAGGVTEYRYNELGQLIAQRNAVGQETRYEYNLNGFRTAIILPLGQRSSRSYDASGQVTSQTDFNGQQIRFAYDPSGKMTSKTLPDSRVISYTYNAKKLRQSVADSRGTTSYAYNSLNQLTSVVQPDGQSISYEYDKAGRQIGIITSGGRSTTTYDALGRRATTVGPDGKITRYTYDAVSNLIRTDLPNGMVETRQYDLRNRLLAIETKNSTGPVSSLRYTLSKSGKRITSTDDVLGTLTTYSYDSVGRLIGETTAKSSTILRQITYKYDAVGNRLERNDSLEGITSYTYDSNGRLISSSLNGKVTQFTYDANGNELTRVRGASDTVTSRWDAENRLISTEIVSGPTVQHFSYEYDADGNRVKLDRDGVISQFLIDSQSDLPQVVLEYSPGGTTSVIYVRGERLVGEIRGGNSTYYVLDGLGSTVAMADNTGAVVRNLTYDGFGRVLSGIPGSTNFFGFAGEQTDLPLGWSYLRARYYDADLGRFVSRDPFEGFATDPQSQEKYLYAHGDPVNNVDPTGQAINVGSVVAGTLGVFGVLTTLWLGYKFAQVSAGVDVSESNATALENSVQSARGWVEKMNGASLSTIQYFFGRITVGQLNKIRKNWTEILNHMPVSVVGTTSVANVNFREFTSQIKEDVAADTIPKVPFLLRSVIRFYPLYWELPKSQEGRTQTDVLIHELTHALVGTTDSRSIFGQRAYGVTDVKRLARSPAKAIQNADSYALEALYLNSPEEYKKRSGDDGPSKTT